MKIIERKNKLTKSVLKICGSMWDYIFAFVLPNICNPITILRTRCNIINNKDTFSIFIERVSLSSSTTYKVQRKPLD